MSDHNPVPKTPLWQNKKTMIVAAVILVAVATLIVAAYTFHWGWTGLIGSPKTTITTEITQPSNTKKVTTTLEDQPGKTLWDWLQVLGVLAIPIVVGFGTAFFTRQQAKTSEANAENQQQEELLRNYFDKMSDLLLDKELSTNPNIQSIVRARTLAALHILNTERKAIVLRFLHDSGLLQHVKSFLYALDLSNTDLNRIDLSGAKLISTTLSGATLSRAILSGANLWGADLSGANLRNATLSGANLRRADLWGANLSGTTLSGTNLSGTKLWGADLSGADLSGADLSEAIATLEQFAETKNVTPEQLAQIKSSKPAVAQGATTAQPSTTPAPSEIKPNQTNQKEAEQQEYLSPKQDTDASHGGRN